MVLKTQEHDAFGVLLLCVFERGIEMVVLNERIPAHDTTEPAALTDRTLYRRRH